MQWLKHSFFIPNYLTVLLKYIDRYKTNLTLKKGEIFLAFTGIS